ncbi:PIR Superfamily Protein [Plasmodium ovale wallikeri]|uniref:PIR Superfamily Protein n=1 Tax=Plasmodium ovale wallikeri TaxID=864142 RepID=A0A1A9AP78_PLAOA|nr:PIR Superfamily Protein [Plasmodium ovale wallikeri]SBT59149.1 PIR Superfamily Protein [Plasmodium ovale wallikeri]
MILNTLNEKDLPAEIFDEKWKTDIKFLEFSNPVILNKKIDMVNWIENFDSKIFSTFNDNTFDNIKYIQDKRCRDLNYYINYVLYYIPKITKNNQNTADIIDKFQRFINGIFISWGNVGSLAKFKCTREHKDYTDKMYLIKQLDDYCENKKSFQEKLQKYDYTTCCKYATYVRYKKRSFRDYILRGYLIKSDDDFHIENSCTLKKSGVTFPDVMCDEGKKSEFESDELPIAPVNGHLVASQQHMLSGNLPEDSLNSSPTKIALTSVSALLGACLSGLYLYRHSFVGSMLRNFQNKNHISNEDTYDDINGMFSEGALHYLSSPADNDKFYISYDSINN